MNRRALAAIIGSIIAIGAGTLADSSSYVQQKLEERHQKDVAHQEYLDAYFANLKVKVQLHFLQVRHESPLEVHLTPRGSRGKFTGWILYEANDLGRGKAKSTCRGDWDSDVKEVMWNCD